MYTVKINNTEKYFFTLIEAIKEAQNSKGSVYDKHNRFLLSVKDYNVR